MALELPGRLPFVVVVVVVTPLGKLRKLLHALLLRHRASSEAIMLRRYFSKPCRLSSVRDWLLTVRRNQDLAGSCPGGGCEHCETSVSFSWTKSLYRFLISCLRRGSCKVMLYCVYALPSTGVAVDADGIDICSAGVMAAVFSLDLTKTSAS